MQSNPMGDPFIDFKFLFIYYLFVCFTVLGIKRRALHMAGNVLSLSYTPSPWILDF
jgi:hypothetical protein